jgi:hypothetical protein
MSDETKLREWFPIEGIGFAPIVFGDYRAEYRPFPRSVSHSQATQAAPLWVVEYKGAVIGTAEGPWGVREIVRWHESHPKAA